MLDAINDAAINQGPGGAEKVEALAHRTPPAAGAADSPTLPEA